MKKFRIGVVLEQGGFVEVEAEDAEKAKEKVMEQIQEDDFDTLDVEITHREFYTIDEEEIQ